MSRRPSNASTLTMSKTSVASAGNVGDDSDGEEPAKPLFRGFVGGNAFITKKGYKGMKLPNLWVKQLFDAFLNDDDELAEIALTSKLADVLDRVEEGYNGNSYSIGDYGFYSKNQFDYQHQFLKNEARKKMKKTDYLSAADWNKVDDTLEGFAYHGISRFDWTVRGDTLAALAVRSNAFSIAKRLLNDGVDPFVENEDGDDLFCVLKLQYKHLVPKLIEVQNFKAEAERKVLVPSEIDLMLSLEESVIEYFNRLSTFVDDMHENFVNREKEIASDKTAFRVANIRNEKFDEWKQWNIDQDFKCVQYLRECGELKGYIAEKLAHHRRHASSFVSLADLLKEQIEIIEQKQIRESEKKAMGITSDDNESQTVNSTKSQAGERSQVSAEGMKKLMKADGGHAEDFFLKLGLRDNDFMKESTVGGGGDGVEGDGMSVSFLNAKAAGVEQYSAPLGTLKKTGMETLMYR